MFGAVVRIDGAFNQTVKKRIGLQLTHDVCVNNIDRIALSIVTRTKCLQIGYLKR